MARPAMYGSTNNADNTTVTFVYRPYAAIQYPTAENAYTSAYILAIMHYVNIWVLPPLWGHLLGHEVWPGMV